MSRPSLLIAVASGLACATTAALGFPGSALATTTPATTAAATTAPATTAPATSAAGRPDIVSETPQVNTPNVLNGDVAALAQIGNTVYVGGKFASVEEHGGDVAVPSTNLFAYDATTGRLIPAFSPRLVGGGVDEIIASPDGGSLWISGYFRKVDGAGRTQRVAEIDARTGAVITAFKSPVPDARVTDMNLVDGTLYLGGQFTSMRQGVQRDLIAAVDARTGALLPGIDFQFGGPFNGGSTDIRAMDVSPDGRHLAVVGNFTSVDGSPRKQIALIDLTADGVGQLSDWHTTAWASVCPATNIETDLRDIAFAPDNSYLVVVTTGGDRHGSLCDTASRWELDPDDPAADQSPTWVEYTGGDTITRVVISDTAVYVGGHFRWLDNPLSDAAGGGKGVGAVARTGLAALDPLNGSPYSWNPTRDRGYGVFEFALTPDGLLMGHDTKHVGHVLHSRLAYFPYAGGTDVPAGAVPTPNALYSFGTSAPSVVRTPLGPVGPGGVAGAPTGIGDSGADYRDARGAFIADDTLYVFRANDTITYQPWLGGDLGPAKTLDIGDKASSIEFGDITGLFYDPSTRRIYFTKANQSNRLYFTTFNPQTRQIGTAVQLTDEPSGDPNWSAVAGMTLVGNRLYYVEPWNGNLKSVIWTDGSMVPETQQVVSTAAVSGVDWSSTAMVAASQ